MSGRTKKQNHAAKRMNAIVKGSHISSVANFSQKVFRRAIKKIPPAVAPLYPTEPAALLLGVPCARPVRHDIWCNMLALETSAGRGETAFTIDSYPDS
jgi:hypothetical protein